MVGAGVRGVNEARRASRKRTEVHELVAELDVFSSAQDIHRALTDRGAKVGLSTVYRNLQQLAEDDEIDTLRNEDGEVLYRKCGERHHHHLVCRTCGQVQEIEGPAVERWADRAAQSHGYSQISHTVEIFGLCPQCRSGV